IGYHVPLLLCGLNAIRRVVHRQGNSCQFRSWWTTRAQGGTCSDRHFDLMLSQERLQLGVLLRQVEITLLGFLELAILSLTFTRIPLTSWVSPGGFSLGAEPLSPVV